MWKFLKYIYPHVQRNGSLAQKWRALDALSEDLNSIPAPVSHSCLEH